MNFAQTTDKFYVLKNSLEVLDEYSEIKNIPLNDIHNIYVFIYKKELVSEYQNDDFLKIFEEIYR